MSEDFNYNDEYITQEEVNNAPKEEAQKYLTFISDNLTFAVSAAHVSEIITNHHITFLPMVPSFIKGIINLRGQSIPIIDIRQKMHKSPLEPTDTTCIIVLDIKNELIGIYVDAVSQVVDVYESNISPMPANSSQELVNGMMSLPNGKVILFLDSELIIS